MLSDRKADWVFKSNLPCCIYMKKIERTDRNERLKSIHKVERIDLRFKKESA